MKTKLAAAAALALLAACGSDPQPGDLTAEESDQLNEAAAMLDNADAIPVSEDAAASTGEVLVADEPGNGAE